MKQKSCAGFTLIEVMIVTVVMGILAAIAVPAYNNYIQKSRRSDAISTLLRIQLEQEKWRANNPAYAASLVDLGWAAAVSDSDEAFYQVTIVASDATTFTISAVPTVGSSQENDSCGTFAISESGRDTTGAYAEEKCWNI